MGGILGGEDALLFFGDWVVGGLWWFFVGKFSFSGWEEIRGVTFLVLAVFD